MNELLVPNAGLDSFNFVVSRTVKVPHSSPVPTVVRCLQNNQLTDWDLVIQETSGTTNIQVILTITNENGEYTLKQPIGMGGAWKYQGFGSVIVSAEAVNASTGTLVLSLTPPTSLNDYICVGNTTTYQVLTLAANWYPVENLTNVTPAGYSPPFCTHVTLLPSFTTDIRFVDQTGTPVWFPGLTLKTSDMWRNIRLHPWYKLEASPQNPGQGLVALWHNNRG